MNVEGSNPFARSTFSTKDLRFRRVKVSTARLNKFIRVTPVSHCSLASQTSRSTSSGNVSASEIFPGQLTNQRLFLPLLDRSPRSKTSNRRSESRTLYDAILGTFPLRPAQRRPRFLPVSVSSSFNAVTGVQGCRKTVRNSGF